MPANIASIDSVTPLDVVGDQIRPLMSGTQFELFDLRGPEGSGPPPHTHAWDEGYLVLEGEIVVVVDGAEHRLGVGGTAFIPARALHYYRIASTTARFVVCTGVGARGFFTDVDATVPHGPPTEATMPALVAAAKRSGLTSPLFG